MSHRSWFLYLIRTRSGALYAGIAIDVQKRLGEHRQGKRGAKYLRSKGPLQLVYSVAVGGRSLTSKAEYRIKRLSKSQKENVVASALSRDELLHYLNLEDLIEDEEPEDT